MLKSFVDVDCRVRYFGCESMYNIAKVGRASMLLFFKEVSTGCILSNLLSRLSRMLHFENGKILAHEFYPFQNLSDI